MPAPADRLVIALAQLAAIVGDIDGNLSRLRAARAQAAAFGADIVMSSELFLSGYPPEDPGLTPAFQETCRKAGNCTASERSALRANEAPSNTSSSWPPTWLR